MNVFLVVFQRKIFKKFKKRFWKIMLEQIANAGFVDLKKIDKSKKLFDLSAGFFVILNKIRVQHQFQSILKADAVRFADNGG